MRSSSFRAVAAAIALSLTVSGVAFAADATPGTGQTDIYVQGTQTTGNSTTYVIEYRTQGGTVCYSPSSSTISSYGRADLLATSIGGTCGAGFNGSAIVSADQDIAAIGLINWTGGSAATTPWPWNSSQLGDGLRAAAYRASNSAVNTLYFPFTVVQLSGTAGSCDWNNRSQYTQLAVQNTTANPVTIGITYTHRLGHVSGVFSDTIPGYGQNTYDFSSNTQNGVEIPDWRNSPNTTDLNLDVPCQWAGNVQIYTKDGSSSLAGAATNITVHYNEAYQALTASDAGSKLIFPSIERRLFDSTDNGTSASDQYRTTGESAIQVLNIGPTDQVVSFTFVTRNPVVGYDASRSFTMTIPSKQSRAVNTRIGINTPTWACKPYTGSNCTGVNNRDFYQDASFWDDVVQGTNTITRNGTIDHGSVWVGSVIVQASDPSAQLVGTAKVVAQYNEMDSGTYAGVPQSTASNTCYMPYVTRKKLPNGYNGEWDILRITVPGSTASTNTNVYFYNTNGTDTGVTTLQSKSIAANGGGIQPNVLGAPSFSGLGTNWSGSIRVTSDVPVICVIEHRYSTDDSPTNNPNRMFIWNGVNR